MNRTLQLAATGRSILMMMRDSASSAAQGKQGLAYNTAGLSIAYSRQDAEGQPAAATAITLVDLASPTAAWSSGGFKELSASLMPGWYRLDLPDALLASGATCVAIAWKGGGVVEDGGIVELPNYDPVAAPSNATVGGYAAGQDPGTLLDSRFDALDTITATIAGYVDSLEGRIPAALVGGRMDASVGATQSNAITGAGLDSTATAAIAAGVHGFSHGAKWNNLTHAQMIRALVAILAAKSSGHDTGAPVFRNLADTANAVSISISATGRITVTIGDLT